SGGPRLWEGGRVPWGRPGQDGGGVPGHWVGARWAHGAFEARDHVAHGVVAHVPHMDAPRRIGEHLQHVVFLPRVIVAGGEDAPLVPDLLPAGLRLAGIVAFARHRIRCRNPLNPWESNTKTRKN